MLHEALNAPWLLIILYLFPLVALAAFIRSRYYAIGRQVAAVHVVDTLQALGGC